MQNGDVAPAEDRRQTAIMMKGRPKIILQLNVTRMKTMTIACTYINCTDLLTGLIPRSTQERDRQEQSFQKK